jgi:hypothetical protein
MTTKVFEVYRTQLDRKLDAKNSNILLFINHCGSQSNNTIFLNNIKVVFLPVDCTSQLQPSDFGIIPTFKFHYRRNINLEDCSHNRWGTAPRCCTDEAECVVCSPLNSRTFETRTAS